MLEIYALLGCSKQQLSYWQINPYSTSSIYNKTKRQVIQKAQKLFSLSPEQAEDLANKAGLTLERPPIFRLSDILDRFHTKNSLIYQRAFVTERMFFYYKNGDHITKESLLALAVLSGLAADETDILIRQCGFCLSRSMPADAIVAWFLQCRDLADVNSINEVLYELELPLLGTRG